MHCGQSYQLFEERIALSNSIASWRRKLFTYRLHRSSWAFTCVKSTSCPWVRTWGLPTQQPQRPPHYTQMKPKLVIRAQKALHSTTCACPLSFPCICFLTSNYAPAPFIGHLLLCRPLTLENVFLPPFLHINLSFIFQNPVLPHCMVPLGWHSIFHFNSEVVLASIPVQTLVAPKDSSGVLVNI